MDTTAATNSNIETTAMGSRRHHYVGRKGDLRVELHYKDFGMINGRVFHQHAYCGREAALYVFREREPKAGCFIPMCQLWAFLPREIGKGASIDAVRMGNLVAANAKAVALRLYGIETQSDTHRVLDVMCDYLEDLKNHPPETGLDKTLDEFLAECDAEDMEFFVEINGEKVHLG